MAAVSRPFVGEYMIEGELTFVDYERKRGPCLMLCGCCVQEGLR
jgi:hypothetical protein